MMLSLYAGLTTLAAPLLRVHLQRRVASGLEMAGRLGERRGIDPTPRPAGTLVWLHAASVGETMSILPVIEALLVQAGVVVLVTTGTVTSAELLASRMAHAPRVLHRFVPLDVPAWTARFVAHWRPDVAGFVESEIWPNLLAACAAHHVPLMLINGRISPSSFAQWRRVPTTAARVFRRFDAVLAQSDADAGRLARLGARHVESPGNLKLAAAALPVDAAELARLRALLGHRPVWLAASTHPGEEAMIRDVHQALAPRHPGLLTIIAPRHPQRGAAIQAQISAPEFKTTRRGASQDPPDGGIWIADTLGELGLLCRVARIVFVGRSLAVGGGQNPLEPARLGCAVATGPLTANFAEPVSRLQAAGALAVVVDTAGLFGWVESMLQDKLAAAAMGRAAAAASVDMAGLPGSVADRLLALARQTL
jgi:3-deoxy-D-manno-octulosonic-acid transferase